MNIDKEARKAAMDNILSVLEMDNSFLAEVKSGAINDYNLGGNGIYEFYRELNRKQRKKLMQHTPFQMEEAIKSLFDRDKSMEVVVKARLTPIFKKVWFDIKAKLLKVT